MRRRGLTLIWPQYFDADRSIREGRRIPKEIAISNPIYKDLYVAAKRMKLEVEVDTQSKYPRNPLDSPGLILVNTKGLKKREFLKKFAPAVQRAKDYRIKTANQPKKKAKKGKTESRSELLKQKIAERKAKQKK